MRRYGQGLLLALILGGLGYAGLAFMTFMPGNPRPEPAKFDDHLLGDLSARIEQHVVQLAVEIGARHRDTKDSLQHAAIYIARSFEDAGYVVRQEQFSGGSHIFQNIEASVNSREENAPIVIVGAHYDTVPGSPGANDNASGVAVLLELARLMKSSQPEATLRFIAFANEERPFFNTENMGSLVHARRARERNENIAAMYSLETLGYYDERPRSQRYPRPLSWFYPDTGDFLGFVGNLDSRTLVRESVAVFRASGSLPAEGFTAPQSLFKDISRSDHASFWQHGYRALMVTDTAGFRYPFYHTGLDTADGLDYRRMARLTLGMVAVLKSVAGGRAKLINMNSQGQTP